MKIVHVTDYILLSIKVKNNSRLVSIFGSFNAALRFTEPFGSISEYKTLSFTKL